MKIGNIDFPNYPLFLAPMEEVTDLPFRLLCKQFGADLVFTEFVSSDALIRKIERSLQKITFFEAERPIAIQLYGQHVDAMVQAALMAEELQPDIIDLNFGCPVKKVANKGAGAGLLKNIPQLLKITTEVVKAVKLPVTVKTRLGWDENNKIVLTLAEQLQDCGIQALTIHARTRSQMYRGEADWTLIGEVKNNPRIKIPIIGNGDVTTPQKAKEYFDKYRVDAIMIGRGSLGQPWIFKETKEILKKGEFSSSLSFQQKKEILKNYILSCIQWIDFKNEEVNFETISNIRLKGIIHARCHLAATPIFKNIPNFKNTRIAMLRAETIQELFQIIDNVNI